MLPVSALDTIGTQLSYHVPKKVVEKFRPKLVNCLVRVSSPPQFRIKKSYIFGEVK